MKKAITIMASVLLLLLMAGSISAYGGNGMGMKGKGFGKNQGGQIYTLYDNAQINHQIDNYPIEEISQEEINGLLLMREEEKLAGDVYLELYDVFGQQIFSNIARSEETHTNAVKSLLDKYNIEDPVVNDERGVFENDNLQSLYGVLVEQGSVSLLDALKVGATIEDLDIKDLLELNEITDNQDITTVYNNLEKGSRNHLRSFIKLIEINDGTYTPQYISEVYYDSIISGDIETDRQYDSLGNTNKVNPMRNNAKDIGNSNTEFIQQGKRGESQSTIAKMWRGFKNWFK